MDIAILPDALLERIKAYCRKHEIELEEFIIDAITEKLKRAYKERRKKPRL